MNGRMMRGLVLTTAVALMLSGCAHKAPGAPSTSQAGVPTPSPSATPVVTAQPLRVPTTCDQLMPASVLAQIGPGLIGQEVEHTASATSWMNTRVGALTCQWSNGASGQDSLSFVVAVSPEVTREGFDRFLNGEQGGGIHSPAIPDGYTLRISGKPPGFLLLTPHYGASGDLTAGTNIQLPSDADAVALTQVDRVVAALGEPGPLWKPSPTLAGATDCDGLAAAAQLQETTGLPSPRVVKADDGEYSVSSFDIDRQVGGYWCTWVSDDPSISSAVSVSVLPGGAHYATKARPAGSVDVSGVGESAFRSPDGRLNVIAAGGWVQVGGTGSITPDQQTTLAKQVLLNVGYTG